VIPNAIQIRIYEGAFMKALFVGFFALWSSVSLACINTGDTTLCAGDTVYPDAWEHTRGGSIIAFNPHSGELSVRSNSSGSVSRFSLREIAVPRGCVEGVCVNDTVFPDSWEHARGGRVLAINHATGVIKVVSNSTGNAMLFKAHNLARNTGCLNFSCVGDTVFPDSWEHAKGGRVVAVNPMTQKLAIVSNSSGNLQLNNERDVALTRGCIEGVCVGDLVYPDAWTHAYGGSVLAINFSSGVFRVLSKSSGNMSNFKVRSLAIGNVCVDYTYDQRSMDRYIPRQAN
jgi:hypothetical protein